MGSDNTLLIIAVIAVIVSGVALYFVYSNTFAFSKILLAPTDTGDVDVYIESAVDISVTTDVIGWGGGYVNTGHTSCTLDTQVNQYCTDPAAGTWNRTDNTTQTYPGDGSTDGGFIVQNDGNVDVILSLYTNLDAAGLLGGTSPAFQNAMGNVEAQSCYDGAADAWSAGITAGTYYDVNNSVLPGTDFCDDFNWEDGQDSVEIDILLTIPDNADAQPKGTQMISTMTITAVESGTP